MARIIKNSLYNFLVVCLIFSIVTGWIFSGWPQIYNLPPKIQKVQAITCVYGADNGSGQCVGLLTTGSSWSVPSDWTDVNKIEVVGGGGGGAGGNRTTSAGKSGGGGGAYSAIVNLAGLTPGVSTAIYGIGAAGTAGTEAGAGGNGSGTWFNAASFAGCTVNTTCTKADFGRGGSGVTAGVGGATANGIGTAGNLYAGGAGGTGNTVTGAGGGGGGGAGGPLGTGGKGANASATGGWAAGGGGGNGGGSAGTIGTAANTGGAGGNNQGGTGGGTGGATTGNAGASGGGGEGAAGRGSTSAGYVGGAGSNGTEWSIVSWGSGGGSGGGGGNTTRVGGAAGATIASTGAGGGAGGGSGSTSYAGGVGKAGAAGFIVITYTPAVVIDTPTFTDATGTYNNDLSETITVASPASAVICYTTNGDTPAATSPGTCSTGSTYSGAVSITTTATTLKAIGTKVGYVNSAVQSATYTLQVADPAFGTNGGSFNNDTTSTQTSTTTGAVFCQTVDGTTNPAASTPGTCSVGTTGADATVIATGKTIKVLGTKASYVNSAVQTSNAFTLTVGAITSSPGAGTYGSTQSVTLNIATTTSAVAHYTTNGDAVTCASTTYTVPFDVLTTTTVKAIGCKTNYVSDTAISDLYTLNLNTAPSFSVIPADSPDPVVAGYNVTFSGTATDSESDSWYLAVCKTNSITAGAPPTCDTSQTYCVSTSAVASGSQNTCTWTSSGSTAQTWYAFACDNNAGPLCSSNSNANSPITVNAVVVSVSVSPATTNYGIMAVNEVRKADTANANDEFIITNAGNVAEDFDIISSDAVGGVGWTLSPTAVGSSIFMHAYSALKTLAASFTLGSVGQQATNWVAMDNDPNYRALANNVAVSGTVDLVLEILSPSAMGNYGVSKDITVTIRATQH